MLQDNEGTPCRIGDTVLYLRNGKIHKGRISNISRYRVQIEGAPYGWYSNFLRVDSVYE